MGYPSKIIVTKAGQEVFSAKGGRLGFADSAVSDFVCFASPIIGAAYVFAQDAAERIADMGYATTITQDGVELITPARRH